MNKKIKSYSLALALSGLMGFGAQSAMAASFTLNDFTGDDAKMFVEVTDIAGGVRIQTGFTADTANTGDITGFWLGLNDNLFNPSQIQDWAITFPGLNNVTYSIYRDTLDLGKGINLTGQNGYALTFDLDIGLAQNNSYGPNDIIESLTIEIATAGLTAAAFDAFAARLQTTTGSEGSSKLAGGGGGSVTPTPVPEPATMALLGAGLAGLGWSRRRKGHKA